MLWLGRQLTNIIANLSHCSKQLNPQLTTPTQSTVHTFSGDIGISLLTAQDSSIIPVNNDLN